MKKVHAIFSLLLVSGWSHAYSTVFNPFTGKLDYVGISTSSLAAQAILNQATLQSGATFYVSSGTVAGPFIVGPSPSGSPFGTTGVLTITPQTQTIAPATINFMRTTDNGSLPGMCISVSSPTTTTLNSQSLCLNSPSASNSLLYGSIAIGNTGFINWGNNGGASNGTSKGQINSPSGMNFEFLGNSRVANSFGVGMVSGGPYAISVATQTGVIVTSTSTFWGPMIVSTSTTGSRAILQVGTSTLVSLSANGTVLGGSEAGQSFTGNFVDFQNTADFGGSTLDTFVVDYHGGFSLQSGAFGAKGFNFQAGNGGNLSQIANWGTFGGVSLVPSSLANGILFNPSVNMQTADSNSLDLFTIAPSIFSFAATSTESLTQLAVKGVMNFQGNNIAGTIIGVNIAPTFGNGSDTLVGLNSAVALQVAPTINVVTTSTNPYQALLVNPTETSVPSIPNYLARFQTNGVDKVSIANKGLMTVTSSTSTTNIPVAALVLNGKTSGTPGVGEGVEQDFLTKFDVGDLKAGYIQFIPQSLDTTGQSGTSFQIWAARNYFGGTPLYDQVMNLIATPTGDFGGFNLGYGVTQTPVDPLDVGVIGVDANGIGHAVAADFRSAGGLFGYIFGSAYDFYITDAGNQKTLGYIGAVLSLPTFPTVTSDLIFHPIQANVDKERMRLTSAGNLLLGTTYYRTSGVDVIVSTTNASLISLSTSPISQISISTGGIVSKYSSVPTVGWGVPAIYGTGRATGQTAANASVATYTVGTADGSFLVSANVLLTVSTIHNFTVTCAYTDEGNTARTLTLSFSQINGTFLTAITNGIGTVPFEGIPLHIRAKGGTAITIATTGTFTTVTYNVEGIITQIL